MRADSLLKRMVTRWQHRTSEPGSSERGDTLVEVLLAMVILGITSVALLAGFATSIAASAEHRNIASLDASTRIAANEAIADVQQQAQAAEGTPTDPFTCTTPFTPSFGNLTGTFTVTATAAYWTGTTWSTAFSDCSQYQPQQYTMTVTSTSSSNYSTSVTTVVSDPSAPPTPNVGAATQLQWLILPGGGTAGSPIAPQPEVAVEDASGYIVQNDFSSVTLTATPITGTGSLSNTCFGVESYGIVQFSGCSFSGGGTYSITASDGNLTAPQPPVTVTILDAAAGQIGPDRCRVRYREQQGDLGPRHGDPAGRLREPGQRHDGNDGLAQLDLHGCELLHQLHREPGGRLGDHSREPIDGDLLLWGHRGGDTHGDGKRYRLGISHAK